jgi:hypothetical protein
MVSVPCITTTPVWLPATRAISPTSASQCA